MSKESDLSRRSEEYDALVSFYGDELLDQDKEGMRSDGPWQIRISQRGPVILKMFLPKTYPSSSSPTPLIMSPPWMLHDSRIDELTKEMIDMWSPDTEVSILWSEFVRGELPDDTSNTNVSNGEQTQRVADVVPRENDVSKSDNGVCTFIPPTSRYNQTTRHFQRSVITDERNRRVIFKGAAFHPPKSGPSETLIAHVASVTCGDHVDWVLAELLFNDKKVAKATHNMIAYRYFDTERNCSVSDNDDDGEKGAGAKLGALLEMADANNVIVVVSRWFGGILLGPSRFKYIASTARDALVEAGYIVKANSKK